jgi:hypothetical protein
MNDKKIVILLGVIALLLAGLLTVSFLPKEVSTDLGAGGGSFVPREFVVSKTLTSSEIASSTATDITVPVNGDMIVDNIIIQTDATGLAAGTNFVISSTNTVGTTTVASHAVSGLGAYATLDLNSTTVKQRTVLNNGNKLTAKCTVADCTGAGKVYITVKLIKASPTAYIYD